MPDVGRRKRQFAISAVHQNGKLDTSRATVIHQRVNRGSGGPTCEKNVVKKDNVRALDVKIDLASVQSRNIAEIIEIIAIKRDIERAKRDVVALRLRNLKHMLSQRHAAFVNSNKGERRARCATFKHLKRKTPDFVSDIRFAQDLFRLDFRAAQSSVI